MITATVDHCHCHVSVTILATVTSVFQSLLQLHQCSNHYYSYISVTIIAFVNYCHCLISLSVLQLFAPLLVNIIVPVTVSSWPWFHAGIPQVPGITGGGAGVTTAIAASIAIL